MATIQDPNFWKRFSVAVHQDDAAKEEMAKRPDLKHSYVVSLSASEETPSPVTTPTSVSHLSPVFTTQATPFQPPSPVAIGPLAPEAPSQPTTPTTPTLPRRLTKTPTSTSHAKAAKSPRRPSLAFTRHGNSSQLTLGLSGRPPSRFKFWTSVTADPSNRDSWLESQRKKRRQRTWMCWAFWVCFLVIVAGVVVCILLLKSKKII